jgi:glucosylceramidase
MAAVDLGRRLAVVPLAVAIAIALFALGTAQVARGAANPVPVEVVQTSAALAQALTRLPDTELRGGPPAPGLPMITVNDRVRYQHVKGFGVALTDSSAWLLERRLPLAQRAAVLEDLFGPEGLHLNFLRVPMGASDFTRNGRPYTI